MGSPEEKKSTHRMGMDQTKPCSNGKETTGENLCRGSPEYVNPEAA